MRLVIACMALAFASAALAQDSYPPLDLRTYVKQAADAKTAADAAMAAANAASAKIPVPSDTAPRITRAAIVTTDGGGAWSVTWKTSLAATPVVLPIPVAASSQPIICMPSTVTVTGAAGRCWYARTLPAALVSIGALVSYDVFGAAAVSTPVQVLAIPPTQ